MPGNLIKPKLVLLGALLLAVTACAGPGADRVLDDIAEDPLGGAFIEGVPFFPEDDKLCGPAAIASVMGYYGARTGMEEARRVYDERLQGSLPMDMLLYAKDKGFYAKYYEGGLEDLKANLASGRPLILFLNMGLPGYPAGHYVVAIGYNDRYGTIIAHSGMNGRELISYDRLSAAWSMTGYSTLLLTPPEQDMEQR